MDKPTCSIDGCEKQAHCRGWCPMHYHRWKANGDPMVKQPARNYLTRSVGVASCELPDCTQKQKARGLCNGHYKKARRAELQSGVRVCPDCQVTKPLSDFPPRATRRCFDCGLPRQASNWRSSPIRPVLVETMPAVCAHCGEGFRANRRNTHYCSTVCATGARLIRGRRYGDSRRARIAGLPREVFTKWEIFVRDNWFCGLCAEQISDTLPWPHPRSASLDHIIPLSRGGAHTRENVQASHLFCNLSKNNKVA